MPNGNFMETPDPRDAEIARLRAAKCEAEEWWKRDLARAEAAEAGIARLRGALVEIIIMYRRAQEIGGDPDAVLNAADSVARAALHIAEDA